MYGKLGYRVFIEGVEQHMSQTKVLKNLKEMNLGETLVVIRVR